MAEGAKVRLVRCPKCENVLPELPDFSLYQCGGCGAVLKGKAKGILEDPSSEVSGDLRDGGVSGEASIVNGPELEMESMDVTKRGRVASDNSSTSRAPSREFPPESDLNRKGKERIRRVEEHFDDDYTSYSRGLGPNRIQGKDYDLNLDRPTYGKGIRHPAESLRPGPVPDQWGVTNNGPGASYGVTMQGRYDNFRYHDEGPSRYEMNSYYQHGDRTRYPSHNLEGIDSMENLENGRAELLRKLDELKDQLSNSCEMTDIPKERVGAARRMVSPTPPDPHGRHNPVAYVQENLAHGGLDRMRKPGQTGPHDTGDPHLNQMHGFFPYTDTYGTQGPDPYLQRGYPHEFLGYDDPYHQEMLHRAPQRPQSRYMHHPFHEHFPYGDVNQDLFMLQQHENLFHQPACSCMHCSNKNWNIPPKVNPHDRRSRNVLSNPNLYHNNPKPIQSYSSAGLSYPVRSRNSLTLNSSDLESENDGFHYPRPRKAVVAHKNGRMWRPIAGGAPFVICTNCFELLKLSKKHILLTRNQQKMKCGACSSIILFELGSKDGFFVSVSARIEDGPTEVDEGSSGTVDENVRYWHGCSNSADMNNLSETDKKPKSNKSEKSDPVSPISSLSDDETSPKNLPPGKQSSTSPSTTLPLTKVKSLPEPDFSPDNGSNNIAVSRFEKGNKSKRFELDRTISRQDSIKGAEAESEMDVSLNEFSNSCVSHDSVDISKEEDHRRVNKGNDSFLAGLIKKSFRDFTKSNQSVEVGGSQVYVNGHLIPDPVVKKAEKLAGTIQPGEYWYDITAGFWGVMGHPCLGIIMPNIKEFNYPMPDKCAAGNTGIFVNRRELHQKDLDLLSSRGLPVTRNGSYIVEMSGKVVDEYTREELDGLGKLAPTVERAKHGFGMKVPKVLSQIQS